MNLGESKLKNYITKDQPFGPISSTEIKEMKVMQHLFDKQNLIYEALDSCFG